MTDAAGDLVIVQRATDDVTPDSKVLVAWAEAALANFDEVGEVTIRLVDAGEMQSLNKTYRDRDALTNVLSFPVDEDIRSLHGLLGDIVICPVVVDTEARDQSKTREAHYAHLVIHGVLHLLGYDHIEDDEALAMESLETSLLASLGISDPYIDRAAS
ncbi:MAG: rRNA maturation RNase YbeY [Gammaproteobacteria bacterium]